MSICNNCEYNNKKYNHCTMGRWQANTKDTQAPVDRCDNKSKAKKIKVKRNER